MANNKNIRLRAFSLVNTDLKHNKTNLLSMLCCKLKDSVMNDRRIDRKSTRLNSSHVKRSRMPSSA